MGKRTSRTLRSALLIFVAAALSAALFFLCYHTDNKYTMSGETAADGVLVLSMRNLLNDPFIYLITGWEIYRGRLLAPEDFESDPPTPDEIVFIGQYGGLEGSAGTGGTPHGSATYRMSISLPPDTQSYTLEIPEIYSAYRLYIDGSLVAHMGVPDREGYLVETGNGKVTLRTARSMEIIVAVSDYSHYYSGMVYPPAFGYTNAVEGMLNSRITIRAVVLALSLGVGFLFFGVWLMLDKRRGETEALPLYYAALCFCYGIYICYPVVKTLWTVGAWWYVMESPAYPLILLLVTLIQNRVSRVPDLAARLMAAFGVFVCVWSLAYTIVLDGALSLMMAHSHILTAYTWAAALYLLSTSIYGAYKNAVHSQVMLTGAVVFGSACVMDRLLPMFEPIRFGWFSEISGGFYVFMIGVVMAMEVAGQFRLRLQLEGRVESVSKMLTVHKAYYPEILEKEEELRTARHDFRYHMTTIRNMADKGEIERIVSYAGAYDERISHDVQRSYCEHYIIDILMRMYDGLARQQGIDFSVGAAIPDTLPFDDTDICVLVSNLLENAVEASCAVPEPERSISVHILCKLNHLAVSVENAFNGIIEKNGDRFLSGKQKGREGIGIESVRLVCARYGGSAEFHMPGDKVFRAEILLPLEGKPR